MSGDAVRWPDEPTASDIALAGPPPCADQAPALRRGKKGRWVKGHLGAGAPFASTLPVRPGEYAQTPVSVAGTCDFWGVVCGGPGYLSLNLSKFRGCVYYPTHLSLDNLAKHEKREKEKELGILHTPPKNDRFAAPG